MGYVVVVGILHYSCLFLLKSARGSKMRVLELYSGIGGMHLALKESGIKGKIIASVEINPTANNIYSHNFPGTRLINANIEGLTATLINKLNVDTILMSPPCQPFTRNGLQNDIDDPRTHSFLHVLSLLPDVDISRVLIENVKGFEKSKVREMMVGFFANGFVFQEFILSPHQFGIPNTRHRYYCLAKKLPEQFSFVTGPLLEHLPGSAETQDCFPISDILEEVIDHKYLLADSVLKKRANVLDICIERSRRSCCFTRSYSRFLEGTGSVLCDKTEKELSEVFTKANSFNTDSDARLDLLKSLNLRFFTPREVCRLMCFPESFSFPADIGDKVKYAVLGNSINVKVVSELIKLLSW